MEFRSGAAFCAAVALAAACAPLVRAQQSVETKPPLTFEVASIKPSKPDARPSANFPLDDGDAYPPGARLLARVSVLTYISFAYKLALSQMQGTGCSIIVTSSLPDPLPIHRGLADRFSLSTANRTAFGH